MRNIILYLTYLFRHHFPNQSYLTFPPSSWYHLTMEKAKIRRIAVVLRLSYASGRDLLYGISQYARRKCRWQFHVINFHEDATAEELHSAVADGKLDGMIANAADNPAIAKVLDSVLNSARCHRRPYAPSHTQGRHRLRPQRRHRHRPSRRRVSGLDRTLSFVRIHRSQHRFMRIRSSTARTRIPLGAWQRRLRRAHICNCRQCQTRIVRRHKSAQRMAEGAAKTSGNHGSARP